MSAGTEGRTRRAVEPADEQLAPRRLMEELRSQRRELAELSERLKQRLDSQREDLVQIALIVRRLLSHETGASAPLMLTSGAVQGQEEEEQDTSLVINNPVSSSALLQPHSPAKHVASTQAPDHRRCSGGGRGRRPVTRAMREVWSGLSAHGLNRVFRARTGVREKVFWVMSILIAATCMVALISQAWLEYAAEKTTVSTEFHMVDDWRQYWPEITICNHVPWDYDKLVADEHKNDSLVTALLEYARRPPSDHRSPAAAAAELSEASRAVLRSYPAVPTSASFSSAFARRYQYDIDRFTVACGSFSSFYAKQSARCSQWTSPVPMPTFGSCFRVNVSLMAKWSGFDEVQYQYGFNVAFFFNRSIPAGMPGSPLHKAVIYTGPPGRLGKLDSTATELQLAAGQYAKVVVNPSVSDQTPSISLTKTRCADYELWHNVSHIVNRRWFISEAACKACCDNQASVRVNGFPGHPGFDADESLMDSERARRAYHSGSSGDYLQVYQRCLVDHDCDHLPPQCRRIQHSYASVPGDIRDWVSNLEWTGHIPHNSAISPAAVAGNLTRARHVITQDMAFLTMYLEKSSKVRTESVVPLYTTTTLLTNIGGSMGLLMGISLISLAEFIEGILSTLRILILAARDYRQHCA